MDRLYITSEADRSTVAAVLLKNKYTVRSGSQRRQGTRSYDYFLEFWNDGKKSAENKISIDDEADQLAVATVLIRNKYTVKCFFQKRNGVKEYFYLEYEPNPAAKREAEE
jgi:hypothetical protein